MGWVEQAILVVAGGYGLSGGHDDVRVVGCRGRSERLSEACRGDWVVVDNDGFRERYVEKVRVERPDLHGKALVYDVVAKAAGLFGDLDGVGSCGDGSLSDGSFCCLDLALEIDDACSQADDDGVVVGAWRRATAAGS